MGICLGFKLLIHRISTLLDNRISWFCSFSKTLIFSMMSKKKKSEGIALLSMYNDDKNQNQNLETKSKARDWIRYVCSFQIDFVFHCMRFPNVKLKGMFCKFEIICFPLFVMCRFEICVFQINASSVDFYFFFKNNKKICNIFFWLNILKSTSGLVVFGSVFHI